LKVSVKEMGAVEALPGSEDPDLRPDAAALRTEAVVRGVVFSVVMQKLSQDLARRGDGAASVADYILLALREFSHRT
jgi:hypothetical protein